MSESNAVASHNPYVGPQAFQKEDEGRFFGRQEETAGLFSRLRARRLVLFYAQSGAGKSSLINAGLRPRLEARGFEVLPVGRVLGDAPTGLKIDNIFAYNLMASLGQGAVAPERLARLRLSAFLLGLANVDGEFQYVGEDAPVEDGPTVADASFEVQPRALIVDQLEELFTTHPEAFDQRGDFFQQIAEAMAADPYLYVLLSMRADYLTLSFPFADALPALHTRFHMQRMKPTAALEAIRRPAEVGEGGRPFADGVAEELVDHLRRVRVAGGGEGEGEQWAPGEFVEPVQLQVVCYQLWQSLAARPGAAITRDDLTAVARRALGPDGEQAEESPLAAFASEALAAYYEQSLATVLANEEVNVAESDLRSWFSHKLITPAGTRNFLSRGAEETGGMAEIVVGLLEQQHLLRGDTRAGGRWVELIHDSFIEPIQEANREWEEQQPLIRLAQAWDEAGRPANRMLLSEQQLEELGEEQWQGLGSLVEAYVTAAKDAARQQAEERKRQEQARELARQEQELQHARRLAAEAEKRREAEAARAQEADARRQAEAERAAIAARQAEAERQAASRLKWYLAGALLLMLVASVLAWVARSASLAAQANAETALTAEARATRNLATSVVAQEEAEANEERANAAALEATRNLATAVVAQGEALDSAALAESRRLVYPAVELANNGNAAGALLVSLEAFKQSSPVAAATVQDRFNSLWFALTTAADTVTAGWRFRRPLVMPGGVSATKDLLAGPEAETLAFLEENELTWWPVADPTRAQTATLPVTPTLALFSNERTLLVTASGMEMQLWQVEEGLALSQRDERTLGQVEALALSRTGRRLAVYYCEGGTGAAAEDTEASAEETVGGSSCAIRVEAIANDGRLAPEPLAEVKVATGEEGFGGMAFAGAEGEALLWLSPETVNIVPLQAQRFRLPPADSERRLRALAVVYAEDGGAGAGESREWLVVGGCLVEAGACSGRGFIRWWDLNAGVWLSALDVPLAAATERLLYLPGRKTVVEVNGERQIREWEANVSQWPELACAIAGRNLTLAEWRETFPARGETWRTDPPRAICDEYGFDYGLHISFVEETLQTCNMIARDQARALYEEARTLYRLSAAGAAAEDFDEWALPRLLEAAVSVEEPWRARSCLAVAQEARSELDGELMLTIWTELTAALTPPLAQELEKVDALREQQEALPAAAQDALSNLFLTRYADLCSRGLRDACERARLKAGDQVSAGPEHTEWHFEGSAGHLVTISMDSPNGDPLLTLYDEAGNVVASDDDGGEGYNARLTYMSEEGGDYRIDAGWYGSSEPRAYTLSLTDSRPEPLTLPAAEEVGADEARSLWRFDGAQGEFVIVEMEAPDGGEPTLALMDATGRVIATGEDGNSQTPSTQLQLLLPADGSYLINAGWRGEPAGYRLLVERGETVVLPEGEVEGSAEQRFWLFQGEAGEFVTVAMDAHDPLNDAYLRLLDEARNVVAEADSGGLGNNALLSNIRLPADGSYYLDADWLGRAGAYTLFVERVAPGSMRIGQTVTGNAERQSWQFAGERGDIITAEMNARAGGDPYLRIWNAQGEEMMANDDGGDGLDARLQGIFLPASGTYYLDAGWVGPARQSSDYTLSLVPSLPATAPLNQVVTARPEQGGWEVNVAETMPVTVTVAVPETADTPRITLFDQQGGVVASGDNDRETVLGNLLLAGGTPYYLSVDWPGQTFGYTLAIDGVVPPLLQREATVTPGRRWWRFEGEAGEFVTLALNANGEGDPYLRLLDEQGVQLVADDDSGGNLDALLADIFLPADGFYYVDAGWRVPAGSYRLSLARAATAEQPELAAEEMLQMLQALAPVGQIETAIALLEQAETLAPGSAGYEANHYICWFGAIWDEAETALPYCETAVALSGGDPSVFDSRGIARALVGDEDEAIADLQRYVETGYVSNMAWRTYFIEELEAGRNPLRDPAEREMWLERLRQE